MHRPDPLQLKNTRRLPKEVIPVLRQHAQILFEVLGRKLVGVYVHGSAAMGGFTFAQSDLDYLALVSAPLTALERKKLSALFLETYGEGAPANGIEMSIVVERFAGKDFRYPTPYEFHMGTKKQIAFHGRPHRRVMTDPDLAAHFTITRHRGICIYGKPIRSAFTRVPHQDYLASVALDSEQSFQKIQRGTGSAPCVVPRYAVLNFCRVLALITDGLVTSKAEGALWGLRHVPRRYQPIVAAALQEYRRPGSSKPINPNTLRAFAAYARDRIRDRRGSTGEIRAAQR